jgi:antitoxin HicB
MARVSIREKASQQITARNFSFTVVFEPIGSGRLACGNSGGKARGNKPEISGYQVTVPLLPGLITYGRTLSEAREMARDAILCHLEGLKKDGERIPDEKSTIQEKLRTSSCATDLAN